MATLQVAMLFLCLCNHVHLQLIAAKCKQIKIKVSGPNHLIGRFPKLSLCNKILICKSVIRPIWTYGSEIWATTAISNLKPIEVMQNKILRRISNANWFITNEDIMKYLKSVSTEIAKRSKSYINKLYTHQNEDIRKLSHDDHTNSYRRLHRFKPSELAYRFQKT